VHNNWHFDSHERRHPCGIHVLHMHRGPAGYPNSNLRRFIFAARGCNFFVPGPIVPAGSLRNSSAAELQCAKSSVLELSSPLGLVRQPNSWSRRGSPSQQMRIPFLFAGHALWYVTYRARALYVQNIFRYAGLLSGFEPKHSVVILSKLPRLHS